ncbi:MAG TPA: glycosyltransferase [Bryobacteraceae bacterium]|nr:glycosyltransferase [Bryobacteraceae bacterium]
MEPIRLLAFLEANSVTGPAKNLLQFADLARSGQAGPRVEMAIAAFRRGNQADALIDVVKRLSIPVFCIAEEGPFDRAVIGQMLGAVRDFRPDLIQSHGVKAHFLIRISRIHHRVPWVAFHHGYTWPSLRMRLYNQLDRWSLRAAKQVVTVSLPFREELIGFGVEPRRIEVVHNGIAPEWGAAAKTPQAQQKLLAALGIGPERKVVLIVGRLSREKDHATLLRAFHNLQTDGHSRDALKAHLVIVGDGPEKERIAALAKSLGIAGAVTFTGQVPSAEPYYGIADVAVLSSLSEGSPNALLEAMASRVPAVATAVGGIPEIVSHEESALLIPPGSSEAMAGALTAILSNQALSRRLADRAHELALTRHAPASRTERLSAIYARLSAKVARTGDAI